MFRGRHLVLPQSLFLLLALALTSGCEFGGAITGSEGISSHQSAFSGDDQPRAEATIRTQPPPPECTILDFDTDALDQPIEPREVVHQAYANFGVTLQVFKGNKGKGRGKYKKKRKSGLGIALDSNDPGKKNKDFTYVGLDNILISQKKFKKSDERKGSVKKPEVSKDGALFEFSFDEPVCAFGLTALDIDDGKGKGRGKDKREILEVGLFDDNGDLVPIVDVPPTGNNGRADVDFPATPECNIQRFDIHLSGTGAIDNLIFCPDNVVSPVPPGTSLWTGLFDGGGPNSEVGNAVAIDSNDNIYACGSTDDGAGSDAIARKYTNDGAFLSQIVVETAGNDIANACAIDGDDGLILAGTSGADGFVRAFAANGSERLDLLVGDRVHGVAVDSDGNIYVAAEEDDGGGEVDALLESFDSAGNFRWRVKFGSPGLVDRFNAVATDRLDNVIVVGQAFDGDDNILVAKFDQNGNVDFLTESTTVGNDVAFGVAVDDDNIWVAGFVTGVGLDGVLIRLAPNGEELLRVPIDQGPVDIATGVAADNQGNVAVSGSSFVGSTLDGWTSKYTDSGIPVWNTPFDIADDDAFGVAFDSAGNVAATGTIVGSAAGISDLWIALYAR